METWRDDFSAIATALGAEDTGNWRKDLKTLRELIESGAIGIGGGGDGAGLPGKNGWSPILAYVQDGERVVAQISDWTGSTGTKPAVGQYIGPTGLVSFISSAMDIRGLSGRNGIDGAAGPAGTAGANGTPGTNGWTPILATIPDGERSVHQVIDWTGGTGTKPPTGLYVSVAGYVADIALATNIRGAQGLPGEPGGGGTGGESDIAWLPNVTPEGDLSFSRSSTLTPPSTVNIKGNAGDNGANGIGVPIGGLPRQVLAKQSDDDYDTDWVDQTGGVSEAPKDGKIYGRQNADWHEIPAGKEFNWRGPFQLGNTYNTNDVVIGPDGSDYIAVMDGVVLSPPSPGWDLFLQGSQGGTGSGDMLASVYDPQGKKTDIFKYIEDYIGPLNAALEARLAGVI